MQKFNLLYEPWIKVCTHDAKEVMVSLEDAIINAHKYRILAGETITQDVSMLRFLIACVFTIIERYDINGTYDPVNEENDSEYDDVILRFREYWDNGHFPEDVVKSYFEGVRDRFWLISDNLPFYQITESKGTSYKAKCLYGNTNESMNPATKPLFSMCAGDELDKISLDETARWLIYQQSYAYVVKKTKNAYSNNGIPVSPLYQKDILYAAGKNLFETLLLNLCMLKDGVKVWHEASPYWEQPYCDIENNRISEPDNIPMLYSVQPRRIHIEVDNDNTIGFQMTAGDIYDVPHGLNEQMCMWNTNVKQDGMIEIVAYKAKNKRRLWVEFNALSGHILKKDKTRIKMPGLILWLNEIIANGIIPEDYKTKITCVGHTIDSKGFTRESILHDELIFSEQILGKMHSVWGNMIADEIDKCIYANGQINEYRSIIYGASSEMCSHPSLFEEIDNSIRKWLISVNASSDSLEERKKEMDDILYSAASRIMEDSLCEIGESALRPIKRKEKIIIPVKCEISYKEKIRKKIYGKEVKKKCVQKAL